MAFSRKLWTFSPIVLVVVGIVILQQRRADADVLVDLHDFSVGEVESAGFLLTTPQVLEMKAVGAGESHVHDACCDATSDAAWQGNAWILDADTRAVVWELRTAPTHLRGDGLREFEGTLSLPAGRYIVHYAAFEDVCDNYQVRVRGEGERLVGSRLAEAREAFFQSAVISLAGLADDADRRMAFTVAEPTEVEIYAVGEVMEDGAYDYAWLIDSDNQEVIWKLGDRGLVYAGGAGKNRMTRTTVTLEPGSYAAFAVTDDSHDASDWNAAPPYDPDAWGLTVRASDGGTRIEVSEYAPPHPEGAFVSLIGVGDDALVSQGFSLSRPEDVRVYALGEGSGGEMYDYGWIVDANRRTVWRMEYGRTQHAGGASKNRMADEIVTLEAGNYMVYYRTDGSHSWSDWNSTPPIDRDAWGITLLAPSGDVDPKVVGAYDASADPAVVAQLIGIRDDEHRIHEFSLQGETRLRIYALGEGMDGEMYDYAWIEDETTRRTVWEMTYRTTAHAGGASKNRLFEGNIVLPAGDYALHYESDDSHSFEDWNSTPPDDPVSYGVTVLKENR